MVDLFELSPSVSYWIGWYTGAVAGDAYSVISTNTYTNWYPGDLNVTNSCSFIWGNVFPKYSWNEGHTCLATKKALCSKPTTANYYSVDNPNARLSSIISCNNGSNFVYLRFTFSDG